MMSWVSQEGLQRNENRGNLCEKNERILVRVWSLGPTVVTRHSSSPDFYSPARFLCGLDVSSLLGRGW